MIASSSRSTTFVAALDSARATALALAGTERRRADSAKKTFRSQAGVPVTFRWKTVNGLGSYGHMAIRGESGPIFVRGKGIVAEATAGDVQVWRDSIAVYLGVR
jgi:hypothetical protein